MIRAIMQVALNQRIVVIGLAVVLVLVGIYSFYQLDIEAYPDPVQPMIEVLTLPNALSAEEVERMVTVPLEYGLGGSRNLQRMDSISLFGLSDIRCYFFWDSDYYWDRQEILSNLQLISLPQGISASLSPENPIGEIYRYTVESADHDVLKEKEIEDWVLEKQLKTVPGVIDVAGFGGLTKEYHVEIDPEKLVYYQIPLSILISAIQNSNTNAGGNYLTLGEQAFDVRGIGFIQTLDDIRRIVLTANKSTPVRVGDLADVEIGYAPRLGIVGMNDHNEVVEGIVLMRKYASTLPTLRNVEAKVKELNTEGFLPPGYRVVPYYDRTGLVHLTLRTVFENLSVGLVLVCVVLVFFLGNFRAAIIAAISIPLALCGAFTVMYLSSTPANLISLGAIDFGIIINPTVVVIENIYRRLSSRELEHDNTLVRVLSAAQEVGGAIFFSTLIFVIAFLPLFTMRGVEGVIFSPMSHTYAYALGTAVILAITLTPVLSSFFFWGGAREARNPVWERISRFYHALFVQVLRRPWTTLGITGAAAALILSAYPRLGGEFLPKLEEGNIWAHAVLPLSSSLDYGAEAVDRMRYIFESFPEVTTVVSQLGRPDDGTEATGFFNVEFSVDLKPQSSWPAGLSKADLVNQMDTRLRGAFPGVSFAYSQNIEDNVDEALSGVKAGENVVKVFGPSFGTDERIANEVEEVLSRVAGVTDLVVYPSLGQPNILITPDRAACSRYGLNVGDVNAVVQAAIGGQPVTQILTGDRTFNLVVRWNKEYRSSLDALRRIPIALANGGYVPLAQVADIRTAEGASFIYREALQRYVPVRFAVRGRDLESTVKEAQQLVAEQVKIPRDVRLSWAGQWQELRQANRRMAVVVPIALLLIVGVLYGATTSLVDTFVIMAQIPVACLGGLLALIVTGTPFSVSAAVGFISIFGIAVMDGIVLSFYIRQLWSEGHPFLDSIIMGSDRRLRAMMMTDLVDAFGLLPMALSTRIGAQTQRPLAIVVIGGALSILILTRVLQPVLIYLCHRRLRLTDPRRPPSPIPPAQSDVSPTQRRG
jgi:cobalt-zinc-cadmium resistance protein CzcA